VREQELEAEENALEYLADVNDCIFSNVMETSGADKESIVVELEAALERTRTEIVSLKETLDSTDKINEALQLENKRLEGEISLHKESTNALTSDMISKASKMESERIEKVGEVMKLLSSNQEKSDELMVLAAEVKRLRVREQELEAEEDAAVLQLGASLEKMGAEVDELEDSLSAKIEELEEREQAERRANAEVTRVTAELEQARSRENELETEKATLATELADMNEAFSHLVENSAADREAAVADLERARVEMADLEKALEEKRENNVVLSVEVERLRYREQELEAEEQVLEDDLAELNSIIFGTLKDNAGPHGNDSVAVVESTLDQTLPNKDQMSEETDTEHRETDSKIENQGASSIESLESLRRELLALQAAFASKEDENQSQSQEIIELETALESAVEEGQSFESALFVLESSSEQQQKDMDELLKTKEQELEVIKHESANLKAKIVELERQVRELDIANSLVGQPLDVQLKTLALSAAAEKATLDNSDDDMDSSANSSSCSTISSDDSGFQLS